MSTAETPYLESIAVLRCLKYKLAYTFLTFGPTKRASTGVGIYTELEFD